MSYSLEHISDCTKKLIFNFKEMNLEQEIKASVKEKQKETSIKGFRKGKAPLGMVQKLYGQQIESEALNKFVQGEFFQALTKEELRMVGYPSFENLKYEDGSKVSFDALVEVFPMVKIKDYSSYSFTKDPVVITDEEVEGMKKNHLEAKSEMKELEDVKAKLENGHHAVLNFEGEKEDGSRPEEMKGEEFLLEIGSNQFIPGFEEGMLGMIKGEKKVIELCFPKDYHMEDLQDSKVKFYTELLEIKTKSYPDFDEEMAKGLGFDSLDDFIVKTRKNLELQKEQQVTKKLQEEILEKLVKENSFDIPKALVLEQEKHVQEDLTRTLQQQGFTPEMMTEYFSKWSDDMNTKAEFQVRSGLILDTIAKKYDVKVGDAELDAKIEEMAGQSGMDAEQIKKYYYSDEKIKGNMMYSIREEKTFAKLATDMIVN